MNLQVAAVDVELMKRYIAVRCYLLRGAAPHVIVAALNDGVTFCIGEAHGAVFGIVSYSPDTRGGFHERLVAISIKCGG